jgi:fumarate hydratase class I
MRLEIYDKVNALGIGAQGLGGLTTVLDVKIKMYPTHAASKPVAMIPNCAATRHAHFVMDGSGPVYLDAPSLDLWPDVNWTPDTEKSKRVDLNTLTPAEVASWKPGQTSVAQRQDADRPRCRTQAHPRHVGQGRETACRFHQPNHCTTWVQ